MNRFAAIVLAFTIAMALPSFAEEAAPGKSEAKEEKAAAEKKTEAAKAPSETKKAESPAKKKTTKNKKSNGAPAEAKNGAQAPAKTEIADVTGGGGAESAANMKSKPKEGEAAVVLTPTPYMVRKVSVLFESNPSNCDIEVDGVYVGVTPLEVTLKEGVHGVKISREGYLPWAKAVKAYNGLYVNANLVTESTQKHDITESVKVK